MKTIRVIITALALLALPAMSRAQYIVTDTIIPERIAVKSSQFGITLLNNLDTYLSNYNHKGLGLNYSYENFRDARTGNYRWKYQTLLNVTAGYATQGSNLQYSALIGYNWSGYHPFKVAKGLTLLAGAQIQLEGGALYNPAGGNNPSWRHMLSLDIPMRAKHHSTTLRISYIADLYQSRINEINSHIYRHTFSFGFARTIFKVKKNNRLNDYSPY